MDKTHVTGDKTADLMAMVRLFWFAMFETTEGRWTVASWTVVVVGRTLIKFQGNV